MLFAVSRIVRPSAAPVSKAIQVRNMATLKEIQQRLKSIQNIEKITKSMKMIASTKVAKAQRGMKAARVFGTASSTTFTSAETKAKDDDKILFVAASSDRGLCGGIHSSISKATRRAVAENASAEVVILGDKPKAQLGRIIRNQIALTFNQIGKDMPSFEEASSIVDIIKTEGIEFDTANIIYNKFISAVSYEASIIPAYSEATFKASPNFAVYEIEDDVLANLQEFSFANGVYWAMVEGHAAEMCAKRAAMENATQNAGEIIGKLTMTYNRGRQAVITNELIDIITGASAL
ncbi:ATP synthase F1, gamma subunit [Helicostylum pulchrum]|nr:ATP synthase F1, gamma subunit [Helicostylum pulchrum]